MSHKILKIHFIFYFIKMNGDTQEIEAPISNLPDESNPKIEDKDEEINKLKNELNSKQQKIEELSKNNEELANDNKLLREEIDRKLKIIENLSSEKENLNCQLNELIRKNKKRRHSKAEHKHHHSHESTSSEKIEVKPCENKENPVFDEKVVNLDKSIAEMTDVEKRLFFNNLVSEKNYQCDLRIQDFYTLIYNITSMNEEELDFMKNYYLSKLSKDEMDCLIIYKNLSSIPYKNLKEIMNLPSFSFDYLSPNICNDMVKCAIQYFEFFEDIKKLIFVSIKILLQKEVLSEDIKKRDESIFKTLRSYYLISEKFYQVVEFEENTEIINDNLLHDSDVKKAVIPLNVKEIGKTSFYQCRKLETVIFKCNNLEKIGISAFSGCSRLESITLPDSLKVINEYTFENCKKLNRVKFPKGLERINEKAFAGCKSLTTIEIPSTIKYIGIGAFEKCDSLQAFKIPGAICIYSNDDLNTEINEPASLESLVIDSKCFYKCKELKNVAIKIQTIKESTFSSCTNLENVKIYVSSNSKIEKSAFFGCPHLKNVDFIVSENSKLEVDDSCFEDCKELNKVTFDNPNLFGNDSFILKSQVFKGDEMLEQFDFPSKSDKNIGQNCFQDCKNLKSVTLPDGITKISKSLFLNCQNLKKIKLDNSVEIIEESAFENCIQLEIDELPSNLKSIGANSFKNCQSIKISKFPICISEFGIGSFKNCTGLIEIIFPKSLTMIDQKAFEGCSNLEKVVINAEEYQILRKAFNQCRKLKSISLKAESKIHPEAFKNCSQDMDYFKIDNEI